jgi:mRNA interferase RelE/StbE
MEPIGQKVYKVEISPSAGRDAETLRYRINRNDFDHLKIAVRNLAIEPRPKGVRKIKGTDKAYRIRTGSYRVVYEIYDSDKLVLILEIARCTDTTYR